MIKIDKNKLVDKAQRLLKSVQNDSEYQGMFIQWEIQNFTNEHGLKYTLKVVVEPYKEVKDEDIVRVEYYP